MRVYITIAVRNNMHFILYRLGLRHFFQIQLRQKSRWSQIVVPDLKSRRVETIFTLFLLVWHMKNSLEFWVLDYLDNSRLRSTYWLHCCGINYCASACKWCNGNCCTKKNNQKLVRS